MFHAAAASPRGPLFEGVTVSGNTATWDATGSAAIEKSNIAYVDHSKDVLLTQEFDIASLENGYGTLSATGFTLDKGLYCRIGHTG